MQLKGATNVKIGFTKFAMLRPKEYVLTGSSGTHSVCVCVTHQNTYGNKQNVYHDENFLLNAVILLVCIVFLSVLLILKVLLIS